ncbi:hypothetical protein ACIQC5_10235 [Paenarthrobacter sp. NPDC092416]|uniref:hypothetical protein n=1 Tax=Paenarthrobacter sp. NPDC092416 TaxID=3364386 RepID=UPI0038153EE2
MRRRQSQLLSGARSPGRSCRPTFDRADDEVDRIATLGRKGWLPAYRDSVLFKVAYSWGLRRNEVRHLQIVEFAPEPARPGVRQVRGAAGPLWQGHAGFSPEAPQRPDGI